jgi:hypothetical protein
MSDFNARAEVYKVGMTTAPWGTKITSPPPIHVGTMVECVRMVTAMHQSERVLCSIAVPLEAGFIKAELDYRDIEAISRRADFLRA